MLALTGGVLGREREVASRVERLHLAGERHEPAELERRPLIRAGFDGHRAAARRRRRRPWRVRLDSAVLAVEGRRLPVRLDQEVAVGARGVPHGHRPAVAAPALQQRRGICNLLYVVSVYVRCTGVHGWRNSVTYYYQGEATRPWTGRSRRTGSSCTRPCPRRRR